MRREICDTRTEDLRCSIEATREMMETDKEMVRAKWADVYCSLCASSSTSIRTSPSTFLLDHLHYGWDWRRSRRRGHSYQPSRPTCIHQTPPTLPRIQGVGRL